MKKLIYKTNRIKEIITNKIQGLVYKLDNTGRCEIENNGEEFFIKHLLKFYSDDRLTLFDVGGNRGDYTNLLLKNLKNKKITIHIFEPQESCIKILKEKFLNYKNVFINNFGLSNTEESTILYKDSEQSGLASVYKRNLGHYDIQINMSEKIKIKKGIDYIKKEGINKINLLKIDIEGNELKALEGFEDFINPANVEIIQFEYGGANLDSHSSLLELFAFFESRGYCICKIMKRGLEIKKYHPRLENFMYSNYVAINPLIIKKI